MDRSDSRPAPRWPIVAILAVGLGLRLVLVLLLVAWLVVVIRPGGRVARAWSPRCGP